MLLYISEHGAQTTLVSAFIFPFNSHRQDTKRWLVQGNIEINGDGDDDNDDDELATRVRQVHQKNTSIAGPTQAQSTRIGQYTSRLCWQRTGSVDNWLYNTLHS